MTQFSMLTRLLVLQDELAFILYSFQHFEVLTSCVKIKIMEIFDSSLLKGHIVWIGTKFRSAFPFAVNESCLLLRVLSNIPLTLCTPWREEAFFFS